MTKLTNSRLAILHAAKADGIYTANGRERKAVDALALGGLATCVWRRHPCGRMIGKVKITAKGRAVLSRAEG